MAVLNYRTVILSTSFWPDEVNDAAPTQGQSWGVTAVTSLALTLTLSVLNP